MTSKTRWRNCNFFEFYSDFVVFSSRPNQKCSYSSHKNLSLVQSFGRRVVSKDSCETQSFVQQSVHIGLCLWNSINRIKVTPTTVPLSISHRQLLSIHGPVPSKSYLPSLCLPSITLKFSSVAKLCVSQESFQTTFLPKLCTRDKFLDINTSIFN